MFSTQVYFLWVFTEACVRTHKDFYFLCFPHKPWCISNDFSQKLVWKLIRISISCDFHTSLVCISYEFSQRLVWKLIRTSCVFHTSLVFISYEFSQMLVWKLIRICCVFHTRISCFSHKSLWFSHKENCPAHKHFGIPKNPYVKTHKHSTACVCVCFQMKLPIVT